MPATVVEKRTMARGTLFWPDVIEEIALVADESERTNLWAGAAASCLSANGFPSSVVYGKAATEERVKDCVKAFLDFVRNHFELVDEDHQDGWHSMDGDFGCCESGTLDMG